MSTPQHIVIIGATSAMAASRVAGGIAQLVAIRVESRPTGRVWGRNSAMPGPLDGQPECHHFTIAEYSDGSRREWGPMAKRQS